jgi:hypothetical protein
MSTLQSLYADFQEGYYLYVDETSKQLMSSKANQRWRNVSKIFIGARAFRDCDPVQVARKLSEIWDQIYDQKGANYQADLGLIFTMISSLQAKVKKESNKSQIHLVLKKLGAKALPQKAELMGAKMCVVERAIEFAQLEKAKYEKMALEAESKLKDYMRMAQDFAKDFARKKAERNPYVDVRTELGRFDIMARLLTKEDESIDDETIKALAQAFMVQEKKFFDKVARKFDKVISFFANARKKLEEGYNTPLPYYYHATKTVKSLESIINSKLIIQNQAPRGFGAYISTQDEGGDILDPLSDNYGPYTIALDFKAIPRFPMESIAPVTIYRGLKNEQFTDRCCPNSNKRQWLKIKSDIELSPKNVAMIIYDTKKAFRKIADTDQFNAVNPLAFLSANNDFNNVLVLSRRVGQLIREIMFRACANIQHFEDQYGNNRWLIGSPYLQN